MDYDKKAIIAIMVVTALAMLFFVYSVSAHEMSLNHDNTTICKRTF